MSEKFDPYHRWLSISPSEQPADHYRLLGLKPLEDDADVIESAADRQMAHVRSFQSGEHADDAQRLLNEIAAAKLVLLKADEKAAYDAQLKAKRKKAKQQTRERKLATATPLEQAAAAPPRPVETTNSSGPAIPAHKSDAGGLRLVLLGGIAAAVLLLALGGGVVALLTAKFWVSPESIVDARDAVEPPGIESPSLDPFTPSSARNPGSARNPAESATAGLPVDPADGADSGDLRSTDGRGQRPAPNNTESAPTNTEPADAARVSDPADSATAGLPDSNNSEDNSQQAAAPPAAAPEAEPQRPTKPPVPDAAARGAARQRIAGIFSLADAATAAEKKKIAEQMLATARQTNDDPVAQFALLNMAREIAAELAQVRLAFDAVDLLEANFDFDTQPVRLATLGAAVKSQLPADEKREVVLVGMDLVDAMLQRDDFDAAGKLINALLELARRAKDKPLLDALIERRRQSGEMYTAYKKARSAIATLQTNPDDAEANLVVGRYLTFVKRDWDEGLAHLAKGSDALLAAASAAELADPDDPDAQQQAADAWWNAAKDEKEKSVQLACLAQSGQWYAEAVDDLTGLSKAKAQKRIQEIKETLDAAGEAARPSSRPSRKPKGPAVAKIIVKDKQAAPLAIKQGMPAEFNGATTFDWVPSASRNSLVEFTVAESGLLFMMASFPETKYEGNSSGGWYQDRLTRQQLTQGGWRELGPCAWADGFFMYVRVVEKGQSYRIRTNKYGAPQIILPRTAAEAAAAPETPDEPDLGVFSRPPPKLGTHPLQPQPAPEAGDDLLARVDMQRDAIKGTWKREDGFLTVDRSQAETTLLIPFEPTGEYTLTAKVRRNEGGANLIMGIVMDGRQASVHLDHYLHKSAVQMIDGKLAHDNESTVQHAASLFTNGKVHEVVYRVESGHVLVTVDGKEALDWKGDPKRLALSSNLGVTNRRAMFVGSFGGGWSFQSLVFSREMKISAMPEKDDGLVAHWAFDEGQGDVARDAVGGHHGTIEEATWSEGVRGGALRFDGQDDLVRISNPDALNFDGAITIAAWARLGSLPQSDGGQSFYNVLAHGHSYQPNGEVALRFVHRSQSQPVLFEGGSWSGQEHYARVKVAADVVGEWTHVSAVYDGRVWRIYRDGEAVGLHVSTQGALRIAEAWAIGAHPKNQRHFHGDIDDVRIYNRALSAEEIAALGK